jgi:hypothetical protein
MQTILTVGNSSSPSGLQSGNDGTFALIVGAPGNQVTGLSVDALGNATFNGSIIGDHSVINNSAAVSDVALRIGQTAYVDFSSSTSVPLHIATGDNQMYEMTILSDGNQSTTGSTLLLPNNTTYTNFFLALVVSCNGTATGSSAYYNGMYLLGSVALRHSKSWISTKTTAKSINSTIYANGAGSSSGLFNVSSSCGWQATASNNGNSDTTTLWTSLGTLSFSAAATGRAYVKRVA